MKTHHLLLCLLCLLCLTCARADQKTKTPPPAPEITLRDFKLTGSLTNDRAVFTLSGTAHVEGASGGKLELFSGGVALTEIGPHPKWQLAMLYDKFIAEFPHRGDFPVRATFTAAVTQHDGWNSVNFSVAPGLLHDIVLQGLAAETQFEFAGASRPKRAGTEFTSVIPGDGAVHFSWKEARPEAEGRLFYAAELRSQITVSPGLMRQAALLDFKVMQGEMNRVTLHLRGAGEVTRVQGEHVLAWNVETPDRSQTSAGSTDERLLVIQLNQPQKDSFTLLVQMQTPLGAFPQSADAMQAKPEGATRFDGWFRIVNEGAVRLEVTQAGGLSQISPEQFPESETTRSIFRPDGNQRFAYRFSGADFSLRIQADQILPELSVSQVLDYHLGESELVIGAQIELDIREAPLRELVLALPKGYVIAQLQAEGMNDYFVTDPPGSATAELRVVYGQPVSGRRVIDLRLEHNQALGTNVWTLPRVDVVKAKSVRGQIGVSADAGFRLTADRTQALTEMATAYFPRKVPNLQSAFRVSEPAWEASFRVERMPQAMQADVFHLFSIGEGVAYGSSVMNYVISGAPVSVLRVKLSPEYFNVEFNGKDIRNWQTNDGGFTVQLHTPVSGAYTLLATYERPFKTKGETLGFTGAQPSDAQAEQGYTLVTSAYQFKVEPVDVSPGLLRLETGEVPPDYRLFFDAPILAAYRYTARPFNLSLKLSPLAQGDSLNLVVDRAALNTRVSREGQAITDARYFVKSRGNPHFRVTLPDKTELWSATVNGVAVVPVKDAGADLIPLPQHADPNAVLTVDLKLAEQSADARRLLLTAPKVGAPVTLAEWKLEPDPGQRMVFLGGSLRPETAPPDNSGFGELARILGSGPAIFLCADGDRPLHLVLMSLVLLGATVLFWSWASRAGVYRFSPRHIAGLVLGVITLVVAGSMMLKIGRTAATAQLAAPRNLAFLAPVQQAGSVLKIEAANLPEAASNADYLGRGWPVVAGLAAWIFSWMMPGGLQWLLRLAGWMFFAWTALRWPNGGMAFILVLLAFVLLRVVLPAIGSLRGLPPKPTAAGPAVSESAAVIPLIAAGLCLLGIGGTAGAKEPVPWSPQAESVKHVIRVEDKFGQGTTKIHWVALKGQILPLLGGGAVVTKLHYPEKQLKLETAPTGSWHTQQLVAKESGAFDIEMQYELQVWAKDGINNLSLPAPAALINQLDLTLVNLDVDVISAHTVAMRRALVGTNTVATLELSPREGAVISWKPRSRDLKGEKPVYYAEFQQLYAPAAGVIEGVHYAAIRPAQGELGELVFTIPNGATVTDVIPPPADAANNKPAAAGNSAVSLWRFDPDTHKLRVTLDPPQSRPFLVVIRSQIASGTLPFEHQVGLVSLDGAAGEIGLLGVATGNEVQLDSVDAGTLSPINLEDFPASVAQPLLAQLPGLAVRRAFRYSDAKGSATLKASAVEPDVRVEAQDTLSLGEDRTLLASKLSVDITRAGIFRLSFALPPGLEVESISGTALSHWTELKSAAGRIITLHLTGKTEGRQQFDVSLAGSGLKSANAWAVPQLQLREAGKQRGTLVIVPEQGMRLQVATRDGVTQLDPVQSGIRQKGVLVFRVLQTPWNLALDIQQVDPWIQLTSLEHATVNEAQVKVTANLQYQIENTGVKAFRMFLPTNADNVRFTGDQVADFLVVSDSATNAMQQWEIKLHRRVIGQYFLQVNYLTLIPNQAAETRLRGIQAADVNLQRGFVSVQTSGRLEVRADSPPPALQATEWQNIPRILQRDLPSSAANFTYRRLEPSYELPLKLDRHEAAKLLPARINSISLTSVVSDDGDMLTQARLEMIPGDKRLLQLRLPESSEFWFVFVNQNGVTPWRETNHILIPLEQPARGDKAITVEFFYSSRAGAATARALDLDLQGPKFDLPLEGITWRVYLDDKWNVSKWSGSLQLQKQETIAHGGATDPQAYLSNEAVVQRQINQQAEQMFASGNSLLANGDPQQARRAFQAAYGLSQGSDVAFNEDARVQFNNIKVQQALVGLNLRNSSAGGEPPALGARFRDWHARKEIAYTQQDAKEIMDNNSAEENEAFMKLAQRIVQQQDAAVAAPAAIRASMPEEGRMLTFQRAVMVDTWADLKIKLQAGAVPAISTKTRVAMLGGTLVILLALAAAARALKRRPAV